MPSFGAHGCWQELKDLKLQVCSALLALGEVSHEGGEFKQAEEDVSSCLAKRKEILPADSR